MLSDLNIVKSWREIFTGEFLYSKREQVASTWEVFFLSANREQPRGDYYIPVFRLGIGRNYVIIT